MRLLLSCLQKRSLDNQNKKDKMGRAYHTHEEMILPTAFGFIS